MATGKRTGPLLRIEGSCEGCAWPRVEEAHPSARPSTHVTLCAHPLRRWGGVISATGTHKVTPDWCPELRAARLALARSIVAEAEGTTIAALAADECPGKGRCHGAMKWCETCGPVAGTCDDTACDQHDAAYEAGESEGQKR